MLNGNSSLKILPTGSMLSYMKHVSSLGHDTAILEKVVDNSQTSYTLINHNLTPGIHYYCNVIAYNHVGMYLTENSDGFTVDDQPPIAGNVLDGSGEV